MPENSRAFATFAEEPSGGGDEKEPWRGPFTDQNADLESHWRAFGRLATGVAVLTAPVFFLLLTRVNGLNTAAAILVTVVAVFAFRGLIDLVTRRLIPSPSLFGDDGLHRERDIADRRRLAFWRKVYRVVRWVLAIYVIAVAVTLVVQAFKDEFDMGRALKVPLEVFRTQVAAPDAAKNIAITMLSLVLLMVINTVIIFGPMLYGGLRQIRSSEPGDVTWGVNVEDVRGQATARNAVRQLATLWQSGDLFERAGGKRERGVLFYGAPGTGKTMLAKALASRFNAPFISAPGPAFNGAFIGIDVILVAVLGIRARRLARKWGGQCIVFLDEIDALGLSRSGVIGGQRAMSLHDLSFHGSMGAITRSGDLVLETSEWRERLFRERAASRQHDSAQRAGWLRRFAFPGLDSGMQHGALRQLLVEMDGVAAPPFARRWLTNRINTLLDAMYIIPTRIGTVPLRLPPVRPRKEDVFFIGACNVPVGALDAALTRPGRLGRHVEFRAPNQHDRLDIINLYLNRIAHDPELDTDERRSEFARITMGHSPAMIEQVCSLALTNAHFDGRYGATWQDLVQATTVIAHGIDRELAHQPEDLFALAVHEAGHAVTGHVFMDRCTSTQLTIRARGPGLGFHSMTQIEDHHHAFHRHRFAELVWTFGAMAAEVVFFGETSTGVAGDIEGATADAILMVGSMGMTANRVDLADRFTSAVEAEIAERKLRRRYEQLGLHLMNRADPSGALFSSPLTATLNDDLKRNEAGALLGQAFMTAYWFVRHNRDATEQVATTLVERQEMFGNEVVELLDGLHLEIPTIDPLDERNWPRL